MKIISFAIVALLGLAYGRVRESEILSPLATEAEAFLQERGHNVNYGSIQRNHLKAVQMREISESNRAEVCRTYNDSYSFVHEQCDGSFAIFGVSFDWSYDNAQGADTTFGYAFGNGWEKDSLNNFWHWNYDDQWTLEGSTFWYTDNWYNNHHHNWTYANTYDDQNKEHDVRYMHTFPDDSYEIFQTHSLPKLQELVHRYQFESGEWWQYQTTHNGTAKDTERFYEWHGTEGSYIYEDYWTYRNGWTYDYQSLDHSTGHWVQIHEYSDGQGGYYESYSSSSDSYTQHCNSHGICTKGVQLDESTLLQ